jgi:UDP-glucose 4-epimerase
MVIPRFVEAALSGRPLPIHGDGRQSRSFLHVRDAVTAIMLLADNPRAVGQVVNVGGSVETTIVELAEAVLRHAGVADPAGRLAFIPYSEAYAPGFEDIRRRVADTGKLRSLTGWSARYDLDDIISDVMSDLRRPAKADPDLEAARR